MDTDTLPELLALDLFLRPRRAIELPRAHGRNLQAWFLRWIEQLSPALSRRLHDPAEERPYTLSPIYRGRRERRASGGGEAPADVVVFQPGRPEPGVLRITSFDRHLTEHLLAALGAPGAPRGDGAGLVVPLTEVTLHAGDFGVEAIASATGSASIPPATTFRALRNRWASDGAVPDTSPGFTLEFDSPTAFKAGRQNVLLPIPDSIVGSLARRWNKFAPPALALDPAPVMGALWLSAHDLFTDRLVEHTQSRRKDRQRYIEIGFIGHCDFVIDPKAPLDVTRAILTLIDFARFAGIGLGTARAMGSVSVNAPEPTVAAPSILEGSHPAHESLSMRDVRR